MVEMLGTLAIIGVLSVVGLAVYRVAVDKHRANTVINEANKRATIVAMQFQQGTTEGTLNEFDNDLGYAEFNSSVITSPDNQNQFQISFTTAPETSVCQQIKSLIPATSVIRKITDNCDTFTYNKDLSSTVYASDFGTPETCLSPFKWCSGINKCSESDDCCANQSGSECKNCNTDTGTVTNKVNYTKCSVENIQGYCLSGMCQVDKTVCDTNEGCENLGNNYYCYYPSYTTAATDTTTAMGEKTGYCKALGKSNSASVAFSDGTITVVKSADAMNWWSAKNWCQVQTINEKKGKLLNFSLERLGCADANSYCTYCCAPEYPGCNADINKYSAAIRTILALPSADPVHNSMFVNNSYNATFSMGIYHWRPANGRNGSYCNNFYRYQEHHALCE